MRSSPEALAVCLSTLTLVGCGCGGSSTPDASTDSGSEVFDTATSDSSNPDTALRPDAAREVNVPDFFKVGWRLIPNQPAECEVLEATDMAHVYPMKWNACDNGTCNKLDASWSWYGENAARTTMGDVFEVAGKRILFYWRWSFPKGVHVTMNWMDWISLNLDSNTIESSIAIFSPAPKEPAPCGPTIHAGPKGVAAVLWRQTMSIDERAVLWRSWESTSFDVWAFNVKTLTGQSGNSGIFPGISGHYWEGAGLYAANLDKRQLFPSPRAPVPGSFPVSSADGALAYDAKTKGLLHLYDDGTTRPLWSPTPGYRLSSYYVDNVTREAVFTEMATLPDGTAKNIALYAAPFKRDVTFTAKKLMDLPTDWNAFAADTDKPAFPKVFSNGGYTLYTASPTRAIIIRRKDLKTWDLHPDEKEAFLLPLWIDDKEAILSASFLNNYLSEQTILRFAFPK